MRIKQRDSIISLVLIVCCAGLMYPIATIKKLTIIRSSEPMEQSRGEI